MMATRQNELLLASMVIGSHGLFWSMGTVPHWARTQITAMLVVYGLLSLFFGAPIILSLCVLFCSAIEDIGVGSILASGLALLTLNVVGLSVYTMLNPPEGGGVFFGHIFSTLIAIPFAVSVFLRRGLNRVFASIWLYEGGLLLWE